MWLKSLMVIVGLALICGMIKGKPLNCEDGEAYWCQNNRTAKQCKKEEYCFPSTTPEVTIVLLNETPSPKHRRLGLWPKAWDKEKMTYETS